MRVVHILRELRYSGAERMLQCSMPYWSQAGIETLIIGMGDGDHPFAPELIAAGCEVVTLPPVRSARGLRALGRTLRSWQPQIVHVHPESCFDAVTGVAAVTPGVAGIVRTVHSSFNYSGNLKFRRSARVRLARRLGVTWVAISDEVAATESRYLRGGPDFVIENWVDVDGIEREGTAVNGAGVRASLGIPSDSTVISVIGNCDGVKNHAFVPAILDRVEMPQHVLHVGDPKFQPAEETTAWARVADPHSVHHLGESREVAKIIAASDVILVPSLQEGVSLVAIEALCEGAVVIGADVPGLRWLVGFRTARVEPFDPAGWAAAIEDILQRGPDTNDRAASMADARQRFSPSRGVSEYLAAYEAAERRRGKA